MMEKAINKAMTFGWILFVSVCLVSKLSAHEQAQLDERKPVCLKAYPTDPDQFNEFVSPYVTQIIQRHGLEEWKAVLLTNELHRHLGMWSIIGAKMGVRAREVLGAPFDELEVISFSGYKPPFSCMSDGLQVSTGASLGRATITNTHLGQPEALFIHKGKRLRLSVKPEVKAQVGKVIKALSKKYGFRSHQYFHELDKISVKYWLEWDRTEIFEEITE
ncbi:MAG: formylmethanofuran dehydrogenase subunit E family protein [Desulfobacteraceae bacterium]|jgi:pyrimidine-specific ribonucleoside hydrolase